MAASSVFATSKDNQDPVKRDDSLGFPACTGAMPQNTTGTFGRNVSETRARSLSGPGPTATMTSSLRWFPYCWTSSASLSFSDFSRVNKRRVEAFYVKLNLITRISGQAPTSPLPLPMRSRVSQPYLIDDENVLAERALRQCG